MEVLGGDPLDGEAVVDEDRHQEQHQQQGLEAVHPVTLHLQTPVRTLDVSEGTHLSSHAEELQNPEKHHKDDDHSDRLIVNVVPENMIHSILSLSVSNVVRRTLG